MFGFKKIKQAEQKKGSRPAEPDLDNRAPQPSQAAKVKKEAELLEAEKVFREGIVSVRDIIAPASFKVSSNFLQLNNLYVRTLLL